MSISVIGESNIDVSVRPTTAITSASGAFCKPCRIGFHHGGVGRNIAHNLSLLGHKVRLASVFGDDSFAKSMMEECEALGIDLSMSTQIKGSKSPIFLGFNDPTGNLEAAFSDVEINSRLDLGWIEPKMAQINLSDLVVVNTILSVEALAHLIGHCVKPLYIDTVSPGRATRLSQALQMSERKEVHTLKCNLGEATAITSATDPEQAAKLLNHLGIRNVYITLGADGVIHCANSKARHFQALEAQIVDVTGSGDAFLAGVVHANRIGLFGEEAVRIGLMAAKKTIESEETVNSKLNSFF